MRLPILSKVSSSYRIKRLIVGQMQANCYLVIDESLGQAVIIDPGDDAEYIIDTVTQLKARPMAILATHGHFDHVMAGFALQHTFSIPFYMHPLDQFLLDGMDASAKHFLGLPRADPAPTITHGLEGDMVLVCGSIKFFIIYSPGHTPGSVSIITKDEKNIFVGDLLFHGGSVGRTDFSYSDATQLIHSIGKILDLPDATIIYPGHGDPTTVGGETLYHRAI
ncbi:MAG: MBL fold metallo-hydrolase [Candidatus Gottesmanbacteria bacterium]|nr:MBL fold metallo-hydrolase [Candidatus Gottesmanbacteria bacterium]